MHVHTLHSGMCTLPFMKTLCRESYTCPAELYATLKRLGMDLVTVTDHDSIDAAEALRRHSDFFLSEEVTCRLPTGNEIHVGVYDINERQHTQIQRRRGDFESLVAYLGEQDLLFGVNHVFSALTGRRDLADFAYFEAMFPAFEALNGQMPAVANRNSAELASALGKAPVAGSDAHTLVSAGRAWTEVAGARTKAEFLAGLRRGLGQARGESGGYARLTRDILCISAGMVREKPATAVLAPLALAVPLATLANYVFETCFAWRWMKRVAGAGAPKGSPAFEQS